MKKIIHLSDLHFGTERPHSIKTLIRDVEMLHADLIVISGDLTQRARSSQFQAAKNFINHFVKTPLICVPGNHDIPLYNLFQRFINPFKNYHKWINHKLNPEYHDATIALFGINSVTAYKPMGGYVTQAQLDQVTEFFQRHETCKIKIVVMHHNLIRSERHNIINDSAKIIATFAACQVNLVLSGHIHYACIEPLKRSHIQNNMYIITAGTPISYRTAAPNSYNVIEFDNDKFKLSVRELGQNNFMVQSEASFKL